MTITVNHYHHFTGDHSSEILKQLYIIQKQNLKIMAANDDLLAKIESLQTTVNDVQQKLADALAAKDALIASQQAQLDALGAAKVALEAELANSVTPDQTTAVIAQIDAVIADVASTPA